MGGLLALSGLVYAVGSVGRLRVLSAEKKTAALVTKLEAERPVARPADDPEVTATAQRTLVLLEQGLLHRPLERARPVVTDGLLQAFEVAHAQAAPTLAPARIASVSVRARTAGEYDCAVTELTHDDGRIERWTLCRRPGAQPAARALAGFCPACAQPLGADARCSACKKPANLGERDWVAVAWSPPELSALGPAPTPATAAGAVGLEARAQLVLWSALDAARGRDARRLAHLATPAFLEWLPANRDRLATIAADGVPSEATLARATGESATVFVRAGVRDRRWMVPLTFAVTLERHGEGAPGLAVDRCAACGASAIAADALSCPGCGASLRTGWLLASIESPEAFRQRTGGPIDPRATLGDAWERRRLFARAAACLVDVSGLYERDLELLESLARRFRLTDAGPERWAGTPSHVLDALRPLTTAEAQRLASELERAACPEGEADPEAAALAARLRAFTVTSPKAAA